MSRRERGMKLRRLLGPLIVLSLVALVALSPVWLYAASGVPRIEVSADHALAASGDGQWTWQNPKPAGVTLNSAFFVDADTGWAVGSMGSILKTVDGGVTWSLQHVHGHYYWLRSVFFVDASTGWAAGTNGLILRTTDGGSTWKEALRQAA